MNENYEETLIENLTQANSNVTTSCKGSTFIVHRNIKKNFIVTEAVRTLRPVIVM